MSFASSTAFVDYLSARQDEPAQKRHGGAASHLRTQSTRRADVLKSTVLVSLAIVGFANAWRALRTSAFGGIRKALLYGAELGSYGAWSGVLVPDLSPNVTACRGELSLCLAVVYEHYILTEFVT